MLCACEAQCLLEVPPSCVCHIGHNSVSLDYCSRWNNASQKVIIAPPFLS
jgi:hypothetical protein